MAGRLEQLLSELLDSSDDEQVGSALTPAGPCVQVDHFHSLPSARCKPLQPSPPPFLHCEDSAGAATGRRSASAGRSCTAAAAAAASCRRRHRASLGCCPGSA